MNDMAMLERLGLGANGLGAASYPPDLIGAQQYQPTGRTGSAFWRDIMSSMNQVPRWAYFGLAGLSFGLAYLSYRRKNPKPATAKRRRR